MRLQVRRASRLALSDARVRGDFGKLSRAAESKSPDGARDREHVERPGGQIIHFYVNNPG